MRVELHKLEDFEAPKLDGPFQTYNLDHKHNFAAQKVGFLNEIHYFRLEASLLDS